MIQIALLVDFLMKLDMLLGFIYGMFVWNGFNSKGVEFPSRGIQQKEPTKRVIYIISIKKAEG